MVLEEQIEASGAARKAQSAEPPTAEEASVRSASSTSCEEDSPKESDSVRTSTPRSPGEASVSDEASTTHGTSCADSPRHAKRLRVRECLQTAQDTEPAAPTPREQVAELMARARAAQKVLASASQAEVDRAIRALTLSVCRDGVAEELASFCVEETQLGNFEGKLAKLKSKTRAALFDIADDVSVGVIERDAQRNLLLIAKPVGVVGASSPATHPEATPVIKAINCIKGRNAIVISANPRSEQTNARIVERMRDALALCGLPKDLVLAVPQPSREKTTELFAQADRVWATGGNAIVRYAYTSGTPAFGVGVGNAVVYVDSSADLERAAASIKKSKMFDLASSCSADNSILAHGQVYDRLLALLRAQGGQLIAEPAHRRALASALWRPSGALNPGAVVRSAHEIGRLAGIPVDPGTLFFIVLEDGVGPSHPFSGEKLSVVLSVFRVGGVEEAIRLTNAIHEFQGQGHSAGIYTACEEQAERFGLETNTSRIMVNQPQSLSNSGSLENGMRQTLSLGCGSWGGSATSENIYWRHFVNITYVSMPLAEPKRLPPDQDLFAGVGHLFPK